MAFEEGAIAAEMIAVDEGKKALKGCPAAPAPITIARDGASSRNSAVPSGVFVMPIAFA